jgi:hypothetical protein
MDQKTLAFLREKGLLKNGEFQYDPPTRRALLARDLQQKDNLRLRLLALAWLRTSPDLLKG